MELKHYTDLLGRWAWFILVLTVLSGVAAIFVTRQITPRFEATTTLIITGRSSVSDLTPDMVQRLTGTYIQLAQQHNVLDIVIGELGLPMTARELESQLNVALVPESLLIELNVQDTDPQRAANIANTLVATLGERGNNLLGNDPMLSRFTLHVVEPAFPPDHPIYPWLLLNLVVGVGIGAMAAIGIVLLSNYFDDTIKTSEDVSRLTGLTNLATIMRMKRAAGARGVIASHAPTSAITEEYRLLRTHIEAANDQQDIRTLVVLSSNKGEGKSLTITNLAVVLAQAGKRVVLVDTNLRQPRLHTLFQLPNQKGVTTALGLEHSDALSDQTQTTHIENLSLLTSGPQPTNPAELLSSPAMSRLIERLVGQADVVLFDTPALLEVIDATVLARRCDATLVVIQAAKTHSSMVCAAQSRLDQFGIRTVGTVLNRATQYTHSISTDSHYRRQQQSAQVDHLADVPSRSRESWHSMQGQQNGHHTEVAVPGTPPKA